MQEGLAGRTQLPQHQHHVGVGIGGSEVSDLVGKIAAIADGFACLCHLHFFANGNFNFTFEQVEVLHGSGRMGIGFENAIGLGLEVIPLGEVNEVQGADYGQAAEAILTFQNGNGGFQLMVEKGSSAIGLQNLVDAGFERP